MGVIAFLIPGLLAGLIAEAQRARFGARHPRPRTPSEP
jgi:uncharacterized membrane protein YeaQ/YmgE (transglycosylase-associated protein family)